MLISSLTSKMISEIWAFFFREVIIASILFVFCFFLVGSAVEGHRAGKAVKHKDDNNVNTQGLPTCHDDCECKKYKPRIRRDASIDPYVMAELY